MDLDEIYRELSNLNEQRYTNASRMYWHGSDKGASLDKGFQMLSCSR
jgi:hypothetical protein